jgi:hypothetical protein
VAVLTYTDFYPLPRVFIKVERQLCLIEFLVSMYECNIRSLGTKKLSKNGIHYEDGSQSLKKHLFRQIFSRNKSFFIRHLNLLKTTLEILHHIVNRCTVIKAYVVINDYDILNKIGGLY